jgi:hypothetical protein
MQLSRVKPLFRSLRVVKHTLSVEITALNKNVLQTHAIAFATNRRSQLGALGPYERNSFHQGVMRHSSPEQNPTRMLASGGCLFSKQSTALAGPVATRR